MSFSASRLWETTARLKRFLGNNASFTMILGCRFISGDEPVFVGLGSLRQWFWFEAWKRAKGLQRQGCKKTPFFGQNSSARPSCGIYQARLLRAVQNCRLVLMLPHNMLSPALSVEEAGLMTYLQSPPDAGPSVSQVTSCLQNWNCVGRRLVDISMCGSKSMRCADQRRFLQTTRGFLTKCIGLMSHSLRNPLQGISRQFLWQCCKHYLSRHMSGDWNAHSAMDAKVSFEAFL